MRRIEKSLSKHLVTAGIALAYISTAIAALFAFPLSASAARWDPSTPWNGSSADGEAVSSWARPSIAWALKTKMISGYDTASGREIRPCENIARGRFAVILYNGMKTGVLP